MVESIKGLLDEWLYGRETLKWFIEKLSDDDIDKQLSRKTLNTIRKQCEELLGIQAAYVKALETGLMSFGDFKGENVLGNTPKEKLLIRIEELDSLLSNILEEYTGDEKIEWFGKKTIIHSHLAAMISHESMHIGQIIAFCYATNIKIPKEIANKMVLTG